jgi:glycosyltransferase involved in cell wall biosynthesis
MGTDSLRNPRTKVAFVLPTLSAGGAERVLITMMNGLDRGRFAPELVVLDENGPLRNWVAGDAGFHSLGRAKIRTGLPRLAYTLNKIAPDIIVSTMAAMNYGVLLVKPFLRKRPTIFIREAVVPSSIINNQSMPWLVRSAYKTLYPHAHKVICPAQCIIDEFKNDMRMDTTHFRLLHNPVHTERIRKDQAIGPSITPERQHTVHFICAGRLHKQKGFDQLISALPKLSMNHSWHLRILGTGAENDNLARMIHEYGLQDRVTLHGLEQNPWPLIAGADALLLPSRWEGLPNVVLESLCVGTPVISTNTAGGIREIATLAGANAVKIVDDMPGFIAAMETVTPNPSRVFRPSLLPEYFHMENVMNRFSELLAEHSPVLQKSA